MTTCKWLGVRLARVVERRWRWMQLITNVHRIHHDRWSYGYTFRPLPWAYFPPFKHRNSDASGGYERVYYGWKRVRRSEFHDCTSRRY